MVTAPFTRPRVITDPPGEPQSNMDRDESLAESVRRGGFPPTLRLYGWTRPAISLGRRQQPDDLPPAILKRSLPMVRRPTGGGAVLHDLDELTYAFCAGRAHLPQGLVYRQLPVLLHRSLVRLLVDRGWVAEGELQVAGRDPSGPAPLCFSAPACGDLLYHGRKVAGAALRVWKEGILLQGSIQGLPIRRDRLVEAFLSLSEEAAWL